MAEQSTDCPGVDSLQEEGDNRLVAADTRPAEVVDSLRMAVDSVDNYLTLDFLENSFSS